MCLYHTVDGARPGRHRVQTAWVDVPHTRGVSTTHCRGGNAISATREPNALLPLFPPPVISPPLILSSPVFLQQSITTTPGERRSCHCRSETRCTYSRRMKVRAGLTDATRDQSWRARVVQYSPVIANTFFFFVKFLARVFNKSTQAAAALLSGVMSCFPRCCFPLQVSFCYKRGKQPCVFSLI